MAFRGVQLSYETIRRWCDTFGASYAAKLKRRRPKLGDKWFFMQKKCQDLVRDHNQMGKHDLSYAKIRSASEMTELA